MAISLTPLLISVSVSATAEEQKSVLAGADLRHIEELGAGLTCIGAPGEHRDRHEPSSLA